MTTGRLASRLIDAVPPATGAVVMGTGIVSVALALDGQELLSRILLVVAVVVWMVLGAALPARALRHRERFRLEIRSPAALTAVAGTAVLGSRLIQLGWGWAGVLALVIGLALWLAMIGPVLRHWSTPTIGVSLMLTVATEALALLAAEIASAEEARWLLHAALAPFALGLLLYVFVLARFDLRELAGGAGDHWVTGGALAISTLAAAEITLGAQQLQILGGLTGTFKVTALVLWGLTLLWLPVLLVSELRWPRIDYDVRRWATVFPVGMYAACSFVMAAVDPATGIREFARVWVWAALAVWIVVAAGLLRAVVRAVAETFSAGHLSHACGDKSASDIPPGRGG